MPLPFLFTRPSAAVKYQIQTGNNSNETRKHTSLKPLISHQGNIWDGEQEESKKWRDNYLVSPCRLWKAFYYAHHQVQNCLEVTTLA